MINGKVSQKEIFNVCTIRAQSRMYAPKEFISCQMLRDKRGLLYRDMIECHDLVSVGSEGCSITSYMKFVNTGKIKEIMEINNNR